MSSAVVAVERGKKNSWPVWSRGHHVRVHNYIMYANWGVLCTLKKKKKEGLHRAAPFRSCQVCVANSPSNALCARFAGQTYASRCNWRCLGGSWTVTIPPHRGQGRGVGPTHRQHHAAGLVWQAIAAIGMPDPSFHCTNTSPSRLLHTAESRRSGPPCGPGGSLRGCLGCCGGELAQDEREFSPPA